MTSIKAQREEFDTKPDVGINQDIRKSADVSVRA